MLYKIYMLYVQQHTYIDRLRGSQFEFWIDFDCKKKFWNISTVLIIIFAYLWLQVDHFLWEFVNFLKRFGKQIGETNYCSTQLFIRHSLITWVIHNGITVKM